MIAGALTAVLSVLVITMLGSLLRVALGPSQRDRLLGVVLAGTTGVGFLLAGSVAFDQPALRDAALVICSLALVVAAVRLSAEHVSAAPHDQQVVDKTNPAGDPDDR